MPLRALLYRRPNEPETISVVFENEIYLVRMQRHRQARRYTLRIHAPTREVMLSMPRRGNVKAATEFAQKYAAWIAVRLRRLPLAAPFAHGAVVPLRGVPHRIVHCPDRRGTVWPDVDTNGDPLLRVAGGAPHLHRRVLAFLKREARHDLQAASRRYAETVGAKVKRVTVRDQSSRWGSCSCTGVLSFSWRLVLAPPFVLDYLAAHEVAHLIEMNHSGKFWRLLEQLSPSMRQAKIWLDQHGADLHRYGLPASGQAAIADARFLAAE